MRTHQQIDALVATVSIPSASTAVPSRRAATCPADGLLDYAREGALGVSLATVEAAA